MHPIDVKYGAMQGQVRLRQAIAGFLTEQTHAPTPLDPETICVLNGAGTVIDTLVQVRAGVTHPLSVTEARGADARARAVAAPLVHGAL